LKLGFPDPAQEFDILLSRRRGDPVDDLRPVLSVPEVIHLRQVAGEIRIDDSITKYLVQLTQKTRAHHHIATGVSPRGSLHLASAAQGLAFVEGREYVTPDDVKAIAGSVLAHRIRMRGEVAHNGEMTSAQVVQQMLEEIAVPM
jgi:MoxR-like ATPase